MPVLERTDAWKPRGVRSAWIVALGSLRPRPPYVWMPGWRAARRGAMISVSTRANRSNFPFGAGRSSTSGVARAPTVFSRGASARTGSSAAVSSARARNLSACPATLLPAAGVGLAAFDQKAFVLCTSTARYGDEVPAESAAAGSDTAITEPKMAQARAPVRDDQPIRAPPSLPSRLPRVYSGAAEKRSARSQADRAMLIFVYQSAITV